MMTNKNITVVICCAGMGTRLGIGSTKALVHICGKPLIIHQLELLKDFDDVRIVLGYQAERVIEIVNRYRKDIMYAFNYDYKDTGAGASLSKGMIKSREYIVALDGDILIKSDDFQRFIEFDGECMAVSKKNSDEPICVDIQDDKVMTFTKNSEYEWSGLVKIKEERLSPSSGHTYEMLEPILPIKALHISSKDIDTQGDYDRAVAWVESNYAIDL